MKNRKTISFIAAIILATIILIATNPAHTWLIVYGSEAEEFANHLLSETNLPSPDWTIDMVVIKKNGIVTFNKHNSNKLYAYSPNIEPKAKNISWSHAWGNWYIGTIKT